MTASDSNASEEDEQRRLVPLLLLMTVVTGAVDAISILRLGHIFVANMTGNVVFLGFALAGASGFSASASLVALASFLGGAALGGRALQGQSRRHSLRRAAAAEATIAAAAAVVSLSASGTGARYAMTVLLAAAMGIQNAVVRSLAVPDLTTTVLTLTLTGLAADRARLAQPGSAARRRVCAVGAMLIGAVGGALVVLHASTAWALAVAAVCLGIVAGAPAGWPPSRR
jgi:uncharacterized membrane protein YoaK (UPF0700 family)